MSTPHKLLLVIALLCFLISCRNKSVKPQNTSPTKNHLPSTERKKSALPTSKPEVLEPAKIPAKKRIKKKRDTLKPIVAIL